MYAVLPKTGPQIRCLIIRKILEKLHILKEIELDVSLKDAECLPRIFQGKATHLVFPQANDGKISIYNIDLDKWSHE